jgi:hypothetical protein
MAALVLQQHLALLCICTCWGRLRLSLPRDSGISNSSDGGADSVTARSAGIDVLNSCDVNSVASPDNVHYIPGTNSLIVADEWGSCGLHARPPAHMLRVYNRSLPLQPTISLGLSCPAAGHQNDVAWLYNVRTGAGFSLLRESGLWRGPGLWRCKLLARASSSSIALEP